MSDPLSTSKQCACPECGSTIRVAANEARAKVWCPTCQRDVLTPWAVSQPSVELSQDDGYELAEGFEQPRATVYIPIVCRVCETRMYGTEDQVGQNIPCPDCFAENLVPPPTAEDRQTRPLENLGPDLEVSTGVRRPSLEEMGYSHLFEGDSEDQQQATAEVKRRPLATANEDDEDPQLPKWFLVSRVFTFPFYLSVIAWWLGLSIGGSVVLLMLIGAAAISTSGVLAVGALLLTVVAGIAGVFLVAMLCSLFLNVLQTTADGLDVLYESDGTPIFDRIVEAVFVVISLLYSFLPGFAVGQILRLSGFPISYYIPISAFIFFPIFLLSALEAGSAAVPYSRQIFRTLRHCWWVWLLFYLEVAVLLVLPHVLAELFGWRLFDKALFGPVVLIGQTIIYFRLLGRVAWYGSERISQLDQHAEEAEVSTGEESEVEVDGDASD